jgi:hypothetical protein
MRAEELRRGEEEDVACADEADEGETDKGEAAAGKSRHLLPSSTRCRRDMKLAIKQGRSGYAIRSGHSRHSGRADGSVRFVVVAQLAHLR